MGADFYFREIEIGYNILFSMELPNEMWGLIIRKLIDINHENAAKFRLISRKFDELILNIPNVYYKMYLKFIHEKINFRNNDLEGNVYGGLLFQYFGWSCREGQLDLAKWMKKKYKIVSDVMECPNTLLGTVCKTGNFESCKWLVETFNLPDNDINNALMKAYESGNLEMIKYLHSKTNLTREDATTFKFFPFQRIAAQNGHLKVLKWFHSTFILTKEDIINSTQTLNIAAIEGHIEIVKWFCSAFNLTAIDIVHTNSFRGAASGAHLEILKWLHQNYDLGAQRVDDCYTGAFCAAVEGGYPIRSWNPNKNYLEVLKWLYSTFNINADVVREYRFDISTVMDAENCPDKSQLDILTWLHSVFSFN